MKCPARIIATITFAVSTTVLAAQAPTNFAGRWTADRPTAAEGARGAGGGGGDDEGGGGRGRAGGFSGPNQVTTITQDANTMTVAYPQGPSNVTLTFNFNGTETRNTVPTNFAPETQGSKVAWQADKLVITTTTAGGTQQIRTLSLAAGKLVVETSTPGAGGKPVISRAIYTKAPDAPAGRGGRGRGRGEGDD